MLSPTACCRRIADWSAVNTADGQDAAVCLTVSLPNPLLTCTHGMQRKPTDSLSAELTNRCDPVTRNKLRFYIPLDTNTHTHVNSAFSTTTRLSTYQKDKTNLDFTEARDSEWQWHQLGHMPVCTSLQTDNHASTPSLSFCRPDVVPATQPTASKHTHTHTHTRLTALFLGLPGWAGTRKLKPIWILLKHQSTEGKYTQMIDPKVILLLGTV